MRTSSLLGSLSHSPFNNVSGFSGRSNIAAYPAKNRVKTWFATRYASSTSRSRPSASQTSNPSAVNSASSLA